MFLSVKVIYDRQKLKDCFRQIEDFYHNNVLPRSLFDFMDRYINPSGKCEIDRQGIIEEKERRRKQRLTAEDRVRKNRSSCVESEEVGETNEAVRIMMGLEEVLARLSLADRKQQDHEKKLRRLAHPGRLRFRTDRGEQNEFLRVARASTYW